MDDDKPWRRSRTRSSRSRPKLSPGDRVQARFGGRAKWFSGKVTFVSRDGETADIEYDDGDTEDGVAIDLIRLAEDMPAASSTRSSSSRRRSGTRNTEDGGSRSRRGSTSSTSSRRGRQKNCFSRGDAVEARYRGRAQWLPGTVRAVHRGNTYDVKFDNGKSERQVPHEYVRRPGSELSNFEVGEHVLAKFGGKFKKYPAKITHVHRDGTFDLVYDDGDTENNVDANLVFKKDNEEDPLDASMTSARLSSIVSFEVDDEV